MFIRRFVIAAGLSVFAISLSAQENQYTLMGLPQNLPLNASSGPSSPPEKNVWFDYDNAVLHQDHVLDLIGATTGRCAPGISMVTSGQTPRSSSNASDHTILLDKCKVGETGTFPAKNDYIIFHVVNWGGSNASTLKATKQNWYVYTDDDTWDTNAFSGTRIFGKKTVYLYTIQLNLPTDATYEERYAIDEKHKTPAFLTHLLGIGQLYGINPAGGAEKQGQLPDMWYAWKLPIKYVPSDLQITPEIVVLSSLSQVSTDGKQPAVAPVTLGARDVGTSLGPPPAEVPVGGNRLATPTEATPDPVKPPISTQTPATETPAKKGDSQGNGNDVTLTAKTFDNEGKYHIDFSVAVPITKISDLSYVQSSNTVTAASISKQNIFALFDYYIRPVDIKNTILPKFPYLLTGVAIGSQPLKKALFGVGWGPIYANFYAAMLLNTERAPTTWKCGDNLPSTTAGASLTNRSCPEFNFGLNIAVGAVTDALKSKSSSSSPKK
jgi:hypothetical protein